VKWCYLDGKRGQLGDVRIVDGLATAFTNGRGEARMFTIPIVVFED